MLSKSLSQYYELYESADKAPLYAAPWWLNAVCGPQGWDTIALTDDTGNTSCVIPFYKTRLYGMSAIITPPMTQWLPVLKSNFSDAYSLSDFLRSLPTSSVLDLTIKPEKNTILPGSGYRINFKYSYVIQLHDTKEKFRQYYNEGLRRNVKEAETNYTISSSEDIQTFLTLCESSYRHRKTKPPSWLAQIITRVMNALIENRSGMITLAFHQGVAIAGILVGWDSDTTYYLIGGRQIGEQGASAHALLLDQAVSEAQARNHKFDFEGSMNPGIANFFQSFGSVPESYWQIRKYSGPGIIWSLLH
jgi:hypothetical protein